MLCIVLVYVSRQYSFQLLNLQGQHFLAIISQGQPKEKYLVFSFLHAKFWVEIKSSKESAYSNEDKMNKIKTQEPIAEVIPLVWDACVADKNSLRCC